MNLERRARLRDRCAAGRHYLTLQLFNVGLQDLVITSVQRLMGSTGFSVLTLAGHAAGAGRGRGGGLRVRFSPTTPGTPETATIRIISTTRVRRSSTSRPRVLGGIATLDVAVPDTGDFGDVCLGSFVDRGLVLNNRGACTLLVTGMSSTSADFVVPQISTAPVAIAPGASVDLPLRFQPHARGAASASIRITSNDPLSPKTIRVRGNTPEPRLVLSIADGGDFGNACVCSFRDETLTLSNSGGCALTISGVTSSSAEFEPPGVHDFPLVVAPGDSADVEVRFRPTSFGQKTATVTVQSDDPASPDTLEVSGYAPSGTLSVNGTGHFGPVEFGRRAERVISLCNIGKCDLRVLSVAFVPDPRLPGCRDRDGCGCGGGCGCGCGDHHDPHDHYPHDEKQDGYAKGDQREHGHDHANGHEHGYRHDQCCGTFRIDSNPFPASLRPGSCLPIHLRFTATCAGPQCCLLKIVTDDPEHPETIVYVTGSLHRTLRSALKCWAADELQSLLAAGQQH